MKRFLKNPIAVDKNKDIDFSTRYDDRQYWHGRNEKSRMRWLSRTLDIEIRASSKNVLKMERLQERYHSDGLAAQADDRMGFYYRYVEAYERLGRLIVASYNSFRPVRDDGTQNV